jgi:hypothetical protein
METVNLARRPLHFVVENCWFGIGYTVFVVIGAVIYTSLAGPLFGDMNAAAVAFMLLVLGMFAVAGIVAFFRQPDPYTRSYFRYELMDVPEVLRGKLDTGPVGWLWHVVPMAIAAVILLPFFA